jgi:hypothetical protein
MKVRLISFFTEGIPFDKGDNYQKNAKFFLRKTKNFFESVNIFTPRILIKKDKKWKKIFKDQEPEMIKLSKKSKFKWNKKWARINFFEWKPNLINFFFEKELKSKNEILIYHDFNIDKYPEYLLNLQSLKKWTEVKMNNCDILLINDSKKYLTKDCKKELLDKYLIKNYENYHHIWGGLIVLRKTRIAKQFIKEWKKLTSELDNRSQFTKYQNYKDFVWHSCDQACLGILYYLWKKKKPKKFKKIKCINLYNSRNIHLKKSRIIIYYLKKIFNFFI